MVVDRSYYCIWARGHCADDGYEQCEHCKWEENLNALKKAEDKETDEGTKAIEQTWPWSWSR